ncbi:hypothetical protein OIU41_11645 [Lacticaseibacillus paracasei]|uniref:hypothetical protein n=1 Tax=Lacticaseibacillus paracasei TaxID=1597 RepID=UPI0033993CC4
MSPITVKRILDAHRVDYSDELVAAIIEIVEAAGKDRNLIENVQKGINQNIRRDNRRRGIY